MLTITDYNCTKTVIQLLCKKEIGSLNVAILYLEKVFLFVWLPKKVILILDQDL